MSILTVGAMWVVAALVWYISQYWTKTDWRTTTSSATNVYLRRLAMSLAAMWVAAIAVVAVPSPSEVEPSKKTQTGSPAHVAPASASIIEVPAMGPESPPASPVDNPPVQSSVSDSAQEISAPARLSASGSVSEPTWPARAPISAETEQPGDAPAP